MIARVTTNFTANYNIKRVQDSAQSVYESDWQVSTGLKGKNFSDVSADLTQILKVEDSMLRLESYEKNLINADSYLQSVETSLQSMQSIITEAVQLTTLALNENSAEDRSSMSANAQGLAQNLQTVMNQTFQGKFIFSGQATNIMPAPDDPAPVAYAGMPASTAYYQGDATRRSTVAADGLIMDYGITADNEAFAELSAGLQALWYGLENNDKTSISGAMDQINAAQDAIGTMLGQVGGEMRQIQTLQEQNQNTTDFLTEQLQQLQGMDSTEAIANLTQNEAVLEANLLLISRLGDISLMNYL